MTEAAQSRIKLSDLHGNPGPGLFMDERSQHSADRAWAQCAEFLQSINKEKMLISKISDEELRKGLTEIARYYWSDLRYENRVKRSVIREELLKFAPALNLALDAMQKISPLARQAINIEIVKVAKQNETKIEDKFDRALKLKSEIAVAIASFIEPKTKRTPGIRKNAPALVSCRFGRRRTAANSVAPSIP